MKAIALEDIVDGRGGARILVAIEAYVITC